MAIKASASISLTRVNDADSINIGGRNLLLGSNVFSTGSHIPIRHNTDEMIKVINDGQFVISFDVELKNVIANDEVNTHRVGFEVEVVFEDNTKNWYGLWVSFTKTPKTLKKRIFTTFNLNNVKKVVTISGCGLYIQRVTGDVIKIGKPKLEKGNRPTDWTPAPEDIQNDIDNAVNDSKVEITNEYNSAIDQTSKQLQLLVQNVETITKGNSSTITELSNQLQITSETAQFVKTTTEKLQNAIDEKLSSEEIREWARFDGATLELGASNSQFKCKLSNTELAFFQGENKVAWVSNNELHILTAIITKSIGCGNFTFVDEGDNGFSLI